jgi:hypothetical protein
MNVAGCANRGDVKEARGWCVIGAILRAIGHENAKTRNQLFFVLSWFRGCPGWQVKAASGAESALLRYSAGRWSNCAAG